jgi:hypothetical protein
MPATHRTPAITGSLPDQPLAITIPEPARQHVALRALIRQAIPMLQHPEAHSPAARRQLAVTLTRTLGSDRTVSGGTADEPVPPPTDADAPPDYEPGCTVEE